MMRDERHRGVFSKLQVHAVHIAMVFRDIKIRQWSGSRLLICNKCNIDTSLNNAAVALT